MVCFPPPPHPTPEVKLLSRRVPMPLPHWPSPLVSGVLVRDKQWTGTQCHFFVTETCPTTCYTLVFKQDMQFFLSSAPQLARLFVEVKALKYDCTSVP